MKYSSILIILGLISCGDSELNNENPIKDNGDTLDNGIIEYDLNEDKLSAVDFSNELSLMQQNVLNQVDLLFQADSAAIEDQFSITLFEIDTKLQNLQDLSIPSDGKDMTEALKNIFTFYSDEIGSKMKPMLPILKKSISKRTKEETKKLDDFDQNFSKQEQALVRIFSAEQDTFALANNFRLQEL